MGLLNNLNGYIMKNDEDKPPAADDQESRRLLGELDTAIKQEIHQHFAFEEQDLFPLLQSAGEGGLGDLLMEEHNTIAPLGDQLASSAGQGAAKGFSAKDWQKFRRLGLEFIERLASHIQKEEMGLVPLVDSLIDDETDRELALKYAVSR
jgi:hemerythrin-like domain-containing protein